MVSQGSVRGALPLPTLGASHQSTGLLNWPLSPALKSETALPESKAGCAFFQAGNCRAVPANIPMAWGFRGAVAAMRPCLDSCSRCIASPHQHPLVPLVQAASSTAERERDHSEEHPTPGFCQYHPITMPAPWSQLLRLKHTCPTPLVAPIRLSWSPFHPLQKAQVLEVVFPEWIYGHAKPLLSFPRQMTPINAPALPYGEQVTGCDTALCAASAYHTPDRQLPLVTETATMTQRSACSSPISQREQPIQIREDCCFS